MGYDCYMIFVNTSLDVALARNAQRERTVPAPIVKKNWNTVQQNIGKFQRLFGMKKMIIVDNNNANDNIIQNVYKQVLKHVRTPIDNHVAKMWLKREMEKRKR
jgi:predicted kinase